MSLDAVAGLREGSVGRLPVCLCVCVLGELGEAPVRVMAVPLGRDVGPCRGTVISCHAGCR